MFMNRLRGLSPYIATGAAGAAVIYLTSRRQVTYAQTAEKSFKDTRVIVVGGGYGGIAAAKKLKDQCQVTLVDARDAFHHNMGAQRAAVEAGFAEKTLIPFEPTFGENFKRGKVVGVDTNGKKVTLSNGESLEYDYLIIATGTTGPFPSKAAVDTDKQSAINQYKALQEEIANAKRIVVIGGGAAGVEVAGDIKEDFVDKDVTIIHPRDALVNECVNESFQITIKNRLKTLGVNLILGERVTNLKEVLDSHYRNVVVKTDRNREVAADLAIPCTGLKVNCEAYKDGLAAQTDDKGRLQVGDFLDVKGVSDVYAIGDCNNLPEIKLAFGASTQGAHVADNLKLKTEGKDLKPYKSSESVFMVLSCGRGGGAAQVFGGWVLGDWFARMVKARNVLTPMQWKNMGQEMPVDEPQK